MSAVQIQKLSLNHSLLATSSVTRNTPATNAARPAIIMTRALFLTLTIVLRSNENSNMVISSIFGFETADKGELFFDGTEISQVPAYKRNINTVFQKYALFPHLNVYENIAFPLRLKKKSEEDIKEYLQKENIIKVIDDDIYITEVEDSEDNTFLSVNVPIFDGDKELNKYLVDLKDFDI